MAILPSTARRVRRDRRASLPDRLDPVATLAADLPDAIARGDILVQFQPQVRIADGRITGAEALARWDHPLLGPVDADLLFAAADRAHLADRLSAHVQSLALTEAAAWPRSLAALDLSLNVTPADLAQEGFAAALLARVADSGLPVERLCVEVTESAPITDLPLAERTLEALRAAGIRTALDDFGAGYASLAYLKALPFDRLKIDKSMTADLAEKLKARAIVRGIIAVGAALGIEVIAEGVETRAQLDLLAVDGCGWFQGFLCSGAVDTPTLGALVEDHARLAPPAA